MPNEIQIVKEDINFLEFPTWILDKKTKAIQWTIKKDHGTYEIGCINGLPTDFDQSVLYFVQSKLIKETNLESLEIETTRYEIAKNVFHGVKKIGKNKFDKIMASLEKLAHLSISFKGVFYSDGFHSTRFFSKIDDVILNEQTKKIFIRFNQQYVAVLKKSKFFRNIDSLSTVAYC